MNKDISNKFDKRKGITFEPNNILYGKLRPYLKNWLLPDFKGVALGDFWGFEASNSSPIFDYFLIQTEKYQEVANLSAGTKMPRSDWKVVSETNFLIPLDISEQTAIGSFFRTLDTTITLYKRKLNGLHELKKAYLQQMFPQAGERMPKVRFAGFEGDLEERELGEIADIVGGGTPSTDNDKYWNGNIDWYAPAEIGEQIFLEGSRRKITELGFQESSAKMLPVGTVFFTSRAGIGNTAILTKKGTTNQGFQSIVPHKNELDSYFIFSRTHELKKYGETVGAGSTFVEVSGKQMARMPILMPRLSEQISIGSFSRNLDEQIAAQAQKAEQLKQVKSAYLSKMFIL